MFACCCSTPDDKGAEEFASRVGAAASLNDELSPYAKVAEVLEEEQNEEDNEAPGAAEESTFTAVLQRASPEEQLGFNGDFADDIVVHICRLCTGGENPITRYNAATPEKPIRAGDYFIAVNDISFRTARSSNAGPGHTQYFQNTSIEGDDVEWMSEVMRQQLRCSGDLHFLVSRPYVFLIRVAKRGENMGLDLTYCRSGISLIIAGISAGAVQREAPEVRIGDRIIGVDSFLGSPQQLLVALRSAGDIVVLQMSRPFECS